MTKKDLIKALSDLDDDAVVIISDKVVDGDAVGWSNIGIVMECGSCIAICPEIYYGK
jgi:hypothetical protein